MTIQNSKFNFDFKRTAIYQAVKWAKEPAFRFTKPLKRLFLVLFIFLFLIFLYGFLAETFSQSILSLLLGFSIISLTLASIGWLNKAFLDSKLKKPKLKTKLDIAAKNPNQYNLAEFLSFETAKAVHESVKFTKSKKFSEINSSILFYFLLVDNPKLNFVFSRAILNLNEVKKILKTHFKVLKESGFEETFANDFQQTILESFKIAQKKGHQIIEIGDVITAIAKHDLIFKKILIDSKLKAEDIENLIWWLESLEERIAERKRRWEYKNLMRKGALAKEWAAGYTITLDQYSIDLTRLMKKRRYPKHVGHKKELAAAERVLARLEYNNVLLVGEAGVGKKSIVQGLAVKSALGQSLPGVNYKRIVILDIPAILSKFGTKEEIQQALDKIFQEVVSAGNVVLTINDFHNFVGGPDRPGVIDITGVLSSYLHLPQFQIIATTTYAGLHRYIEQRPGILALFGKVKVSEISQRETLMFLENLVPGLEYKYKKFVTYPVLRDIVFYAGRYIQNIPFPKKAIDLLDEVMVYAASTKEKLVLPADVAKIVSEKVEIPVGEIEVKEKEVLLRLESLIHQRIINQSEAVKEVASALRRARAGVQARKGPMGTFLFLGPTGVGKTETSKALAEVYFGSESRMIRLDMSEFQAVVDIPRLIGSPGGEGLLTTRVREKPFSLILLDEIEKAHSNILNLFLQVLDEGHLTDGLGRKVNFKNSIIIATSNAGYKIILEALKMETDWSGVKQKLLDYLFAERIFRPEFINRFDGVIVFRPLSKGNLLDIAEIMFQKLKTSLKEKGIEFIITQSLKEKIAELGYSPTFGAREMRRVIQDKVENVLASALLSGELKRGDRVEVDPQNNFALEIK